MAAARLLPLIVLIVGALLSGCATRIPKPYTIQGRSIHDWVLYTETGAKTKYVELPPGYYYPGLVNDGFGFGKRAYWVLYMYPGGITRNGWFGTKGTTPGGVQIQIDPLPPEPKIYFFTGNGAGAADLPSNFRYKLLSKDEVPGPDGTRVVAGEAQRQFLQGVIRSLPPPKIN